MKKISYFTIDMIFVLLIAIFNPITLGKLIAVGGVIDPPFIRYTLWLFTFILFIITLFFTIIPKKTGKYIQKKWKNYVVLIITLILLLVIAESALRILPKFIIKKQYSWQNYEYNLTENYNSDWFRDDEFVKAKDKNTIRIFLIGDSFVYGHGAEKNTTMDKLLERRLNKNSTKKYEVYNMGICDIGPAEYYKISKRFKDYNPDLVIVAFYVDNDVEIENSYIKYKLENNYTQRNSVNKLLNQGIKGILRFVDSLEIKKLYERIIWNFNCEKRLREEFKVDEFYIEPICENKINYGLVFKAEVGDYHKYYHQLVVSFKENPATRDNILAITNLYENVPFILLINPSKYQVTSKDFDELRKLGFIFNKNKTINRELQDEIISWADLYNISYIDVLPFMKENNTELYYYTIDDHYTPYGYTFVTDRVYEKIMQENLLG